MHNFVAYPKQSEDATMVIVIHENRGLNDWARSFADQLAEAGYIAVAPDLISNTVEGIKRSPILKAQMRRTRLFMPWIRRWSPGIL